MTGFASKRQAAQAKLDDDDTQVYADTLLLVYQRGFADGKKAAQPEQEPWRESASDYERGVIDGRQMQAQSSVDKAVNAMTQRPWVGLTPEEVQFYALKHRQLVNAHYDAASDTNIITAAFEATVFYETVEQALKERNG